MGVGISEDASALASLDQVTQKDWDQLVDELAPLIHKVDRAATRIWFCFWPLKLNRLLRRAQTSEDLAEMVRDRRLVGNFRLEEQVDESVDFLYGAYYWPQVKRAVLNQIDSVDQPDRFDLRKAILEAADQAAADAGVDPSIVLGAAAVGFMALRQTGATAFASKTGPCAARKSIPKPDKALRRRDEQSRPGLLGFLKSVDRRYKITFDEKRGGVYPAIHGQDLSMASANDKRDYTAMDPRRLEGPVPFECRSGSCGYCWVGVLGGAERLEPMSNYELKRLRYFGYVPPDAAPDRLHVRLSCQSLCFGDVTIVVPPWNGILRGRE